MKDLFKNYHKHKIFTNLGILGISLVLAISVNMFVLGGNTGQSLKANVLEATSGTDQKSDITAKIHENTIKLSNAQEIQNISKISFSLAYNSEFVEFISPSSSLNAENISIIENAPGFSSYLIELKTPMTISPDTNMLQLEFKRKTADTIHLNIFNVNFHDNDDKIYDLSSQGIMF